MKKSKIFFLFCLLLMPTLLIAAPLLANTSPKIEVVINIETSALPTNVVINEVYFDDIQDQDQGEFIELYNPTSSPIDISGYKITDEESIGNEGVFQFPSDSIIASRGFFVI